MASLRAKYVLTYGLIATTGVEYFYRSQEFVGLLFVMAGFVALTQGVVLRVRPLRVIAAFLLLELAQALYFDNLVITSILSLLVKLFTAYFIVQICGNQLLKYYTNVMYVCAMLALPIYFLTFIPFIENFLIGNVANVFFNPLFSMGKSLYDYNPNIIIYTFNPFAKGFIIRNSGPFWEPGGFAVYLNLALIFNLADRKTLLDRRNLLFILSIITTFSTAGYITLFIILVGYVLTSPRTGWAVKAICVLVLGVGAITAYGDFDFLGSKIDQNISLATEDNTSRFGSAYFDLIDIAKSPWIGFGRLGENRFGELARALDPSIHRNNGVTYLAVSYGLPAAILYFALLFTFLRRYCRLVHFSTWFAVYAFAAILTAGFSQVIFDRALSISFLFLVDRLRYREAAPSWLQPITLRSPAPGMIASDKI